MAQPCFLHSIWHICQRGTHKYILCDPCFIQNIQLLLFSVQFKFSTTWSEGRGKQITEHHRENTQNQVLKLIKSRMSPRQGVPRKKPLWPPFFPPAILNPPKPTLKSPQIIQQLGKTGGLGWKQELQHLQRDGHTAARQLGDRLPPGAGLPWLCLPCSGF